MKHASVTIRVNGERDDVTVDGRTFDRSSMTKEQRFKFNSAIVAAFKKDQGE